MDSPLKEADAHVVFFWHYSTGELDLDCYRQINVSFFHLCCVFLDCCALNIYFKMDWSV